MLNKEIFIMEKINDFNEAKNLLEKYLDKKISINKLKKNFIDDIEFIKEELEKAYLFKDKTKLDILFWLIFTFDLYSEEFINILCKISKEEWHERHEDIAIAIYFMEMKLPSTLECLYELAISDFEKYRHDEYCQLVEKCCYALGAIGTEEAKEKLKLLAKSDKDIIREHVEDTFEMYKLS